MTGRLNRDITSGPFGLHCRFLERIPTVRSTWSIFTRRSNVLTVVQSRRSLPKPFAEKFINGGRGTGRQRILGVQEPTTSQPISRSSMNGFDGNYRDNDPCPTTLCVSPKPNTMCYGPIFSLQTGAKRWH